MLSMFYKRHTIERRVILDGRIWKYYYFIMMVNVILIPYLLGIFVNVSNNSTFDPEYLYDVKQTKIEYGKFTKTTELISTITCQSFISKNLQCNLHDIMFVTKKYNNLEYEAVRSNLIQISLWFKMEFGSYGIYTKRIRYNTDDNMIRNFVRDIIDQFNINNGIWTNVLHSGYTDDENTLIGDCTTTYNVNVEYVEDEDSNFQIRLIAENFSDKKDLPIKNLHILKNRKNCNYSEDWYKGATMTQYAQTIQVIDKRLKIFTKLDGQRLLNLSNPSETIKFTETIELNLLNFRSHKTMSFEKDYLGPDHA